MKGSQQMLLHIKIIQAAGLEHICTFVPENQCPAVVSFQVKGQIKFVHLDTCIYALYTQSLLHLHEGYWQWKPAGAEIILRPIIKKAKLSELKSLKVTGRNESFHDYKEH